MSFVYTVPILLFIALGLIIFLYRIIYKSNMNRALEGEATTGLIDLGSLLKALTFIALLIMNIVALTKISNLQTQILDLRVNTNNQISSLQSSISSLRSTINQYFSEQEMVQNKRYELSNIDFSNNQYHYDFEFSLKEKETNAEVYLVVTHGTTSENILLSSSSLTYTHTMVLDVDEVDYEFSVLIEGASLEQHNLYTLNTKRESDMIRFSYLGFLEGETEEAIYLLVPQSFKNFTDMTVSSVTFRVLQDGVLVDTQTLNTVSDIDALTSSYLKHDVYYEFGEGNHFMYIYEFTHDQNLQFEVIITFSDGTIIEEIQEF